MPDDHVDQPGLSEAPRVRNGDRIIGVGSPHGDDQVGWCLIERLQQENFPAASLRAVQDPVDILEQLEGVCRLILVDACQSRGRPGTVTRFEWLDAHIGSHHAPSTHRISLINALQLAQTLRRLPKQVTLFAVEVESCQPTHDLCPAVRGALTELTRLIALELAAAPREEKVQ